MKYVLNTLNSVMSSGKQKMLDGIKYTVYPVVMMKVGNFKGSNGLLSYTENELSMRPERWNCKPIVIQHPSDNEEATSEKYLKENRVGMVMNTRFEKGKLKADAWIDENKTKSISAYVWEKIKAGIPQEVSLGFFSNIEKTQNNAGVKGVVKNILPDHLAVLVGKKGACSISDGAGLCMNSRKGKIKMKQTRAGLTFNDFRQHADEKSLERLEILEQVFNESISEKVSLIVENIGGTKEEYENLPLKTLNALAEKAQVIKSKVNVENNDNEKEEKKTEKSKNFSGKGQVETKVTKNSEFELPVLKIPTFEKGKA